MNVTDIEHSSFLVELETCCLLFDYFKGEIPAVSQDKALYVFASHRHGDHFSPVIFELAEKYPGVTYILSDDIWRKRVPEKLQENTVFMGPGEEKRVDGMNVRTYRSTDEGVAFLIEAEGVVIYHAGDLNHWRWNGEPEQWNREMGEKYHRELDQMAGAEIDLAFLPLDPRLEDAYCLGADEFMRQVGARLVFPMHFWGDYETGARWKAEENARDYCDRIVEIHRPGERFPVNL